MRIAIARFATTHLSHYVQHLKGQEKDKVRETDRERERKRTRV